MKTIPDYLLSLSGDDFDNLEDIFSNHYCKFVKIYRILEKHLDDIESMSYTNDNDSLTINASITKKKSKDIIEVLDITILDFDNVYFSNDKNDITLTIYNKKEVATE